MNTHVPFAVVGSTEFVRVGNKQVRARQYPWGTVQGKCPSTCPFAFSKYTFYVQLITRLIVILWNYVKCWFVQIWRTCAKRRTLAITNCIGKSDWNRWDSPTLTVTTNRYVWHSLNSNKHFLLKFFFPPPFIRFRSSKRSKRNVRIICPNCRTKRMICVKCLCCASKKKRPN